jgi:response regulator RpfG family c-di-GMP phosphodiesterase
MPGTILIVDDDKKVLEILETSLTRKGHRVHVAENGKEALAALDEASPDMVVLDVMLPDMDGRDVLEKIRSVSGHENVPALFLSASTNPEIRLNALDRGAEDFLVKPFSLREFKAKVKRILDSFLSTRSLKQRETILESKITKREQQYADINKELKKQVLSMKTLFAVSQDLNRRLNADELINGLSLTLVGELQISSIAIFSSGRDSDGGFVLRGLKGFDKKRIADLELGADTEFTTWLQKQDRPQQLVRRKSDSWVGRLPDVRLAVFEYVTPIIVAQKLRGIVFTGPKINISDYSKYDVNMLYSLCNSAGIGLENARLFQELQMTYLSTVKALVSLIEAKDTYTRGHTERVADYAVALGRKMRLSANDLRDLAFGAVLHDIGKLVIWERTLTKEGSLDDKEWELMKKHPEVGAGVIENMEFLRGTGGLIRHHHERFDGNGYPDGLKGEGIPMGARIISVADSFDAMTTDRSYRKALTWEEAIETIRSKAGTQFDPLVVSHFMDLLEKDGFRPRVLRKETVAKEQAHDKEKEPALET